MRKLAIILPHYKTARLTAACINAYRTYTLPIESELILCDNSPGHPSIKAITETSLGKNIKIVQGNPEFPSHGQGYQAAYKATDADAIFTSETDSFPTRHGWFDEWLKASADYDFIGPEMPMGGGTYIHPAGTLTKRKVIEAAQKWQADHPEWVFVPGAGAKLKTSDRAYHVVAHEDWLADFPAFNGLSHEIDLWKNVGVWQEMRCFDEDTFEDYTQRKGITNWLPVPLKFAYNKIGFEPGQWLSYFAQSFGFPVMKARTDIKWMPGHEGRQAAFSTVFGGFTHLWAGSVIVVSPENMNPDVVAFKRQQTDHYFDLIPESDKKIILELESKGEI